MKDILRFMGKAFCAAIIAQTVVTTYLDMVIVSTAILFLAGAFKEANQ